MADIELSDELRPAPTAPRASPFRALHVWTVEHLPEVESASAAFDRRLADAREDAA